MFEVSQNHPNFIVIGGQRCGTTWLDSVLRQHPEIGLHETKEPDYFNRLILKERYSSYLRGWNKADFNQKCIGELSVNYSMMPHWVVKELGGVIQELKLILILRNPVERSWSQVKLIHELMAPAWQKARRPTRRRKSMDALSASDLYCELRHPRVERRSDFSQILLNWTSVYGRKSVHIEYYETVANNPQAMIRRILSHIGLDPNWQSDAIGRRVYSSSPTVMPDYIRAWLARRWAKPVQQLKEQIGENEHIDTWLADMKDWGDLDSWSPTPLMSTKAKCERTVFGMYDRLRWEMVRRRIRQIRDNRW